MCVCVCLPVGRSVHRASYESVYVCRWVCVHRILCVCACASARGLIWKQAPGSLQGWEARRQEGHSSGSLLTKTWRAGPSFLPPFPGSSHSNLAPQTGAGGRAQAHAGCLRKGSPGGVTVMSLPLQHSRQTPALSRHFLESPS